MQKFVLGMLVGVFGIFGLLAIVVHFSMISFIVYSLDLSNYLVTGHFGEMHKSLGGSKSRLSPAELQERVAWSLSKDREYALQAIENIDEKHIGLNLENAAELLHSEATLEEKTQIIETSWSVIEKFKNSTQLMDQINVKSAITALNYFGDEESTFRLAILSQKNKKLLDHIRYTLSQTPPFSSKGKRIAMLKKVRRRIGKSYPRFLDDLIRIEKEI